MDTPEPPKVWPPAPTLPPPEPVPSQLNWSKWKTHALKDSAYCAAILVTAEIGGDLYRHAPFPKWEAYIAILGISAGFGVLSAFYALWLEGWQRKKIQL